MAVIGILFQLGNMPAMGLPIALRPPIPPARTVSSVSELGSNRFGASSRVLKVAAKGEVVAAPEAPLHREALGFRTDEADDI